MPLSNLVSKSRLADIVKGCRRRGERVVFTNGVFDILHRGHVDCLTRAKALGDVLIVGLNSDRSVRRLKGSGRPLQKQQDRAAILLALAAVDYVVVFSEDTPEDLIRTVRPDILVKGADYRRAQIVGADFVEGYGGQVRRIRLTSEQSTSKIIERLK